MTSERIKDDGSLRFFSVDLSHRKAVLLRGAPLRKGMSGINTYIAPYAPTTSFLFSGTFLCYLWCFHHLASGSTASAHSSTTCAVVPLGTSVALPLRVSPSVQLSVAGLHLTVVGQ